MSFEDGIRAMASALQGVSAYDAAMADLAAVEAEVDADYQRKVRRWERDAPKREAAQRAYEAAHRRRDAAGHRPVPVLNCLDWMRPVRRGAGGIG